MENKQNLCAVCGTKSTTKCSACNQVYYCSREHQKQDWKLHKKECWKIKKQKDEEKKISIVLECGLCGVSESSAHLKLCASCQLIAYCCKEHQFQHWKEGRHYRICARSHTVRETVTRNFSSYVERSVLSPQLSDVVRQLQQDLKDGAKRGWLRHAWELFVLLAEANDALGLYNLGTFYCNGFGVKEDINKGVKWLRKAAVQGDVDAQAHLGRLYEEGKGGLKRDMSEAAKFYRQAANQGNAMSQDKLGQCYMNGEGVPKNLSEAAKWYRKAANQGNADTQFKLGQFYMNGEGVPKDLSEAVKWYRKAANQGDVHAQYNLGVMYSCGEGVPKDPSKGVKWYRKAADQGYAMAQSNLGFCYERGDGVPKDLSEAAKWWGNAADQGYAKAQYCIGFCYKEGKGVPKDLSAAVKWFRKSADQGYEGAIQALKPFNL